MIVEQLTKGIITLTNGGKKANRPMFSRAVFLFVIVVVVCAAKRRARAEPSAWFAELILEDQQTGDHDHSGSTLERHNHTCCHQIAFNEDPTTGDDLMHVQVPYNHWWLSGATMFSLATDLDEPSPRMLPISREGISLDFRQRSRLYLRIQCAYPCCLEGAEFIVPHGAPKLELLASNMSGFQRTPWVVDRQASLPKNVILLGDYITLDMRQEVVWYVRRPDDTRIQRLEMCDYDSTGMWIQIDSTNRIEAALAELDVCFVHHDMAMAWDNGLCEEG